MSRETFDEPITIVNDDMNEKYVVVCTKEDGTMDVMRTPVFMDRDGPRRVLNSIRTRFQPEKCRMEMENDTRLFVLWEDGREHCYEAYQLKRITEELPGS